MMVDISFWKNRENIEGLSVRTIFLNTICQLIIFLYLLDNETSFMVLISVGIGVLIEFWKISKACNVTVRNTTAPTLPHAWPKLHPHLSKLIEPLCRHWCRIGCVEGQHSYVGQHCRPPELH